MNERKTYAVVELAELVNVPRTTINDWLEKYSHYIESEVRGKRKVYFDSSVKVLQEIAEMRSRNLEAPEIEAELTKRHPMQPEVAAAPQQTETEAPAADTGELMAPNARRQAEEIGQLLSKELQNIAERLEQNKQANRDFAKRSLRWYILAIALVVSLGATAVVITLKSLELMKLQDQRLSETAVNVGKISMHGNLLSSEVKKQEENLNKQHQDIQKIAVMLDKNSADYQKNLAALQKELDKQRQDFKSMQDNARTTEEKTIAELAKMKDFFAREKLELVSKCENFSKDIAERAQQIEQLKAEQVKLIADQQEKIKLLEKQAADDKKDAIQKMADENKKVREVEFAKITDMSRQIGDKDKANKELQKLIDEKQKQINDLKSKLDTMLTPAPVAK